MIETVPIDKSLDLFSYMIELRNVHFLFRGQTNNKHPLVPGIGRANVQATLGRGRRDRYSKQQERAAFEDFKRRSVTLVHPRVETTLDWLALAQHHGMPTRLLDWSASFLVAAHFAVQSAGVVQGEKAAACIFAVPFLPLASKMEVKDPFEAQRDFMHIPPAFDARISAQKSVFTVHHKPDSPFEHENLMRIDIASHVCFELKAILSAHAIDTSMLFPDIGGIAQHCGWKYKWREYT